MPAKLKKTATLALILAGALAVHPAEAGKSKEIKCEHQPSVRLTGSLRYFGMVHKEPQASPQFHYDLDLAEPWCGLKTIGFSSPQPLFCSNGNLVTLTGELWPPEPPFNTALFEFREMASCAPEPKTSGEKK